MSREVSRRDGAAIAFLGALAALLFAPPAAAGRVFFWGDLTYIHHPWRALSAQIVQRGALPLWNPFSYLGMPLAAQMQSAAWYPGTFPFYLFSFGSALPLYHAAHFFLSGFFMFLWLRKTGFSRLACLGGAAAYMLGGGLVSRIPFLNHVSTLAYFPALLLLSRAPVPLALACSLAFFSGYPSMLAGELVAAWAITGFLERRPGRWAAAGALSLGLTACLLLPAAQLTLDSRRSAGIDEQEALDWSYSPRDLVQFTAPPLIGGAYSPTLSWWKTSYAGLGVCAAALAGLAGLPPAAAAAALAYLFGVLLLILGASNPASHWLWTHAAPLRYIRYPGNTAYLSAPLVAWLASAGLERLKGAARGFAVLCIAGELAAYAVWSQPKVHRGYFSDVGPLARFLQSELRGHRYLASPLALRWHRGAGSDDESAALDLKRRLYGVTNMPLRIYSVGNFGEPLVPAPAYAFMDFIYRLPGLEALRPWLAWTDAKILFTRDIKPAPGFRYLGDNLWHIYEAPDPVARAFWFSEEDGSRIPAGLSGPLPDLRRAVPLEVEHPREDRFHVSGAPSRPGWLFLSEPGAPGWSARDGARAVASEPALLVFQKLRVPAGPWRLSFRYDPVSWRAGRLVTLLLLCGLTAYWYNRLRLVPVR